METNPKTEMKTKPGVKNKVAPKPAPFVMTKKQLMAILPPIHLIQQHDLKK